jgi:hypothetical protein
MLAAFVRKPLKSTGEGRTEREEMAQTISIPTHLPDIRCAGPESRFASLPPSRAHEQPGRSGNTAGDGVRDVECDARASAQHLQPHCQVPPGWKGTRPGSYGLPQHSEKLALH